MKIRPYHDSDWEQVRKIYDLSKPDEMRDSVEQDVILPLNNDASMLELFRNSTILVAEEANQVIGFAGYKDSCISWLFVHPAHRRKGVARALVTGVMARLERPVTLNVAAANYAARQLYSSLGFTVTRDFVGEFNGRDVQVLTLSYDEAG